MRLRVPPAPKKIQPTILTPHARHNRKLIVNPGLEELQELSMRTSAPLALVAKTGAKVTLSWCIIDKKTAKTGGSGAEKTAPSQFLNQFGQPQVGGDAVRHPTWRLMHVALWDACCWRRKKSNYRSRHLHTQSEYLFTNTPALTLGCEISKSIPLDPSDSKFYLPNTLPLSYPCFIRSPRVW
ncbi:hypothetical protein AVEN_65441-1 [Araneus ventricosus]|uniref:Uncharacterized protein n=1 Tax=Araneus ventricosus TaxID=182803 RepID=A0A4Y2S8A9_ARAVE|nr:hypothetical protein AVEN_65441-1 [Araneus ventricosus]